MIVAEHISKYYGDRAAVSDVSFTIKEGEVVGLLGLNGAGKTTILKILSGLLVPTSGRVAIDGLEMSREPEKARARIGFLPEQPPLYGEMAVDPYLRFAARINGFRGNLDAAVARAIDAADLSTVRFQRIDTLSSGFQRRVGIAQAIVHQPALILLDEPTSGLDPRQIVTMRNLITGLRGKNTIMVSSHNLPEIEQVCDRIFVIKDGEVTAEGSEAELAKQVADTNRFNIEVRAAADALREALATAKDVVADKTVIREGVDATSATIELSQDSREDLAELLVKAGLGLRRFERVELELENIFMKLTSGTREVRS
jgi:ABC-2 type transport system ATP-binding protein